MSNKVGIVGYGVLGIQLETYLLEAGIKKDEIIYFDDTAHKNNMENSVPFSEYLNEKYKELDFYVCLGYLHLQLRDKIITSLLDNDRNVPVFIHHTAIIHPTTVIEKGVIIYPGVLVDQHVLIKKGVMLTDGAIVSHNTVVNESCFLAPRATVCGHVSIGKYCFLGAGANISNNISIGENCIIGIGATLTVDIMDNHFVKSPKSSITQNKIKLK